MVANGKTASRQGQAKVSATLQLQLLLLLSLLWLPVRPDRADGAFYTYICVCVSLSVVCTSSVGPQHTEVIRFSLSLSRSACGMLPLDDEPMTLSNKQSNKDYQLSEQYYDMSQLSHTKTHTQLYLCICPSVCIELILFGGTRSRIVHVIVTIYPSTLKFYKLPYCTP